MRRVRSFTATPFYFVATPIGNLKEFSPRAIETLNSVDFIACEDTRTSGLLLSQFNIKKPLISVHKFNEVSKIDEIIQKIKNGETGALISDAGYPLISDPGNPLIKALLDNLIPVSVINGPSAFIPALIGSGLATDKFNFIGFMRGNDKEKTNLLSCYKHSNATLIFYSSIHHYVIDIEKIYACLGERKLVLARELTKLHEEYIYTSLSEFCATPLLDLKGELVLLVEGAKVEESDDLSEYALKVETLIKEKGYSTKEAISIVTHLYKVNKNSLTSYILKK